MNKNPEHFIQHLSTITLGEQKRNTMRGVLASYADLHTIQDSVASATQSPFFSWMRNPRFAYAGALVLLLAAGGSTAAFAAEGTLPGDTLYNIKIHVNEPLAETFAATPEAKARVSTTLAERRVDEATTLAVQGKLDSAKAAYLESAVKQKVAETDHQAEVIAASGDTMTAADVRSDLETRLTAHAEALAVASTDSTESEGAARVLAVVTEHTHVAALARAKSDNAAASTTLAINTQSVVNFSAIRAHTRSTEEAKNTATLSLPELENSHPVMLFAASAKMSASTTASTTATSTDAEASSSDDTGIHSFGEHESRLLPESIAPGSAGR